jgi:mono/diheme cytochrome c family protein
MNKILRGALILTWACLGFARTVTAAPDQPDGAALYKQKCQMCHGADGKGFAALKTPDFTDPKWQASKSDKEIASVIKNGKQGTMMQAFGNQLKDDEIDALVKQIRSFNKK